MVDARKKWFDSFDCERLGLDKSAAIAERQAGPIDSQLVEYLFTDEYMEKKVAKSEQELKDEESKKALKFLHETDWYVIRQIETGLKIPDSIATAREKARALVIKNAPA